MFPFMFNPFGRNNTVNILDLVIPKVKTIALGESTENVVLGICPKVWCRLPKEGVIVLEVRHTIDEEMRRCEDILKILNVNSDITTNVTKDFKELDDLKAEVKELKQLLQNVSAVRPEVIKNTPPNSTEDKKVEPEGEIKKEI